MSKKKKNKKKEKKQKKKKRKKEKKKSKSNPASEEEQEVSPSSDEEEELSEEEEMESEEELEIDPEQEKVAVEQTRLMSLSKKKMIGVCFEKKFPAYGNLPYTGVIVQYHPELEPNRPYIGRYVTGYDTNYTDDDFFSLAQLQKVIANPVTSKSAGLKVVWAPGRTNSARQKVWDNVLTQIDFHEVSVKATRAVDKWRREHPEEVAALDAEAAVEAAAAAAALVVAPVVAPAAAANNASITSETKTPSIESVKEPSGAEVGKIDQVVGDDMVVQEEEEKEKKKEQEAQQPAEEGEKMRKEQEEEEREQEQEQLSEMEEWSDSMEDHSSVLL